MNIPFFMHDLGQEELESVAKVFKGPILTTGETVAQLEKELAAYLDCKHVITVNSCTAGLHLSLMGLDIGPGDEVITTPLTFVATLQAICYAGAKPMLVDVDPATGNLDVNQVEKAITKKTKAILPVHLYGHMVDMRALKEIANKHGLRLIEDAAHCLEGIRDGVRPGQISDTACFSFFATKNITCGEGGAIATQDDALAARLRLLRNHGMDKTSADRHREGYRHWDVNMLGWKYNMSNIEAALLLPQIKRIESKLKMRVRLYEEYTKHLAPLKEYVQMPKAEECEVHSHHLFTVWVPRERRDQVIEGLQKRQVSCVVNYRACHLLNWFQKVLGHKRNDFPVAEKIGDQTLSLPFYPTMPIEHVAMVAQRLEEVIQE
ncbi:MAG: DegT/DnrJ/EryC1/StrS family aminotransferase [Bdellovibrionales bacterium]